MLLLMKKLRGGLQTNLYDLKFIASGIISANAGVRQMPTPQIHKGCKIQAKGVTAKSIYAVRL